MNITQVSNSFNYKTNNNQSFKGLWGKTSHVIDEDKGMGAFINKETRYYHPFSNESRDEISSTITSNSSAYINSQDCTYVIKECKVCSPLNFTKEEYEEYKNANKSTTLTDRIKQIHVAVKDKFKNCQLDEQDTAVNEAVGSRLSASI